MYRTDFWTLWEKARVGCFKRTASKHVYYLGWNTSPAQVGCMRQGLGPGALVAKGEEGLGGKDWEFGVSRWKLLYTKLINNNVLLMHSTKKYIQYPVINHNGKVYAYIYIYTSHFAVHQKLTQYCKSTILEWNFFLKKYSQKSTIDTAGKFLEEKKS